MSAERTGANGNFSNSPDSGYGRPWDNAYEPWDNTYELADSSPLSPERESQAEATNLSAPQSDSPGGSERTTQAPALSTLSLGQPT